VCPITIRQAAKPSPLGVGNEHYHKRKRVTH
jgi:hypothetical protein